MANEWLTQDEIQRRRRVLPALIQPLVQAILPPRPPQVAEPDPEVLERDHAVVDPDIQVLDRDPRALNPEPEHEIIFQPMTPEHLPTRENPQWVHDEEDLDDDASSVDEPLLTPPDVNDPGIDDHDHEVFDDDPAEPAPHQEPTRRSTRPNRGVNRRFTDFFALATALASTTVHPTLARGDGFLRTLDWDAPPKNSTAKALMFLADLTYDAELGHDTLMIYPTILAVQANDSDLPSFAEAMASEDADGFCHAMDNEIQELVKKFAWDLVPASEPEVLKKKVFGTIWAFRRKRYPDGSLCKLKARICCRGDQQVLGVDVFETYAPVISWAVVRLALTTSVAMGWATAQVDYANAFVQAKLDEPVYITCPRRYEVPGYVLRLKRSLYGLRESPLNWFNRTQESRLPAM